MIEKHIEIILPMSINSKLLMTIKLAIKHNTKVPWYFFFGQKL